MSKDKINVNVRVNEESENDSATVKITISDEAKARIPRPGDAIYIVEPYPVDEDEDPTKEETILGYSYDNVMVKGSVLTDELDEVIVNGEYRIPLYKTNKDSRKRSMIFATEEEAMEKYRTLMSVSVKEAKLRMEKAEKTYDYLKEALEKMHH